MVHKWVDWLHHPCRMRGPQRFSAGDQIRSGPQVGGLATSALPSRASLALQSKGKNEQWPTSGQIGYITLAMWMVPNASERGTKSTMAHKWADWLHHPCRAGGPERFMRHRAAIHKLAFTVDGGPKATHFLHFSSMDSVCSDGHRLLHDMACHPTKERLAHSMLVVLREFESRQHKHVVVMGKLQCCMSQSSEEATPRQRVQRRLDVGELMRELQCRPQLHTI